MNVNFKQFPAEIQELSQSNNGLKQALHRLEVGSPETPRSWFYETKSPKWILGTIEQELHGMQDLSEIAQWDLSKSEKFGPQGESAPFGERLESFDEYFKHLSTPLIIKDPIWKLAKREAVKRLKFNQSGSPALAEAVVNRGMAEDKYNTSSGYPLFIKRKQPEAQQEAIEDSPKCIDEHFPSVMGSRATMGKTGVNARHIFMAAMAVNVNGQRYQQPLQDYIRSLNMDFFAPWEGWDHVQQRVSHAWTKTNLKFGADYTKMDQHFNECHGLEVFDVVKHYFKPQYWKDLRDIIQYVFRLPILTDLGYVDQAHSMPSGSEWTNFLETLWNFIFCIYLELKYHLKFECKMGIGDDQLWFLGGKWDSPKSIKWIVDTVIKEFESAGLPGNPEKQEVSVTETGFLQRHFVEGWNGLDGSVPYAGVYSLIRNATSEVYPERYHNDKDWDSDMFALRCIMIAENCNMHPLFKWYIEDFVAKANPNILEFVRKSDAEIRLTEQKAKNIANFIPTYNQEKKDQSILTFHTMKLLRARIA